MGMQTTVGKARPKPTQFFFPGLASSAWHNPEEFPWVQTLESNLEVIRKEYLALQSLNLPSDYQSDNEEHTNLHKGTWLWHSYVQYGNRQAEFATKCPLTSELLEAIPTFMTDLPYAFAFFSTLKGAS